MKTFGELLADMDGGDSIREKFSRETLEESVEALAKSYQNAEKAIHGSLKPPGADAGPDEWASFMKRVGAPEDGSYRVPEGLDEPTRDRALEVARNAVMTQRQFDAVVERMQAFDAEERQAAEGRKSKIRENYGQDFEEAKARALRAASFLKEQGQEIGDIESSGALFASLERLGATMSDDTQPLDTTPPSGKASDKDLRQAALKARTLMESGSLKPGSENYAQSHREYEESMRMLLDAGIQSAFDPRLMDEYDPMRKFFE